MAKLSLWLITLDKNRPFTFLDHALKSGDSLVGVNLDQLTTWSLAGEGERRFETLSIKAQIDRMVALRRRLESIPVNSVADQEAKRLLFAEAEAVAHDLRQNANLLVGSYFNNLKPAAQDNLRVRLLAAARDGESLSKQDAAYADLGNLKPFHWQLEFPEVFLAAEPVKNSPSPSGRGGKGVRATPRAGFDAFVGNPPFIGGKRISTMLGPEYANYLRSTRESAQNTTDIVAYFFLRAFENLKFAGTFGFIATNTIAQGDTREAGLSYITEHNGTIYKATLSIPWPGIATVQVSIVIIFKGNFLGVKILDGKEVATISSLLDNISILGEPKILVSNANKSFVGIFVRGIGFVLDSSEVQTLVNKDPKNAEVIHPYLNGKDFNSNFDQSPSRWIIDFSNWSLTQTEQYPDCLSILRERVYPERQKVKQKDHREHWWRFANLRPGLKQSITKLHRVLVISEVSKYINFAFMQKEIIFSHMLIVLAVDLWEYFVVLQSIFHDVWAQKYASSLGNTLRYTPSDVFETFPFPESVLSSSVDSPNPTTDQLRNRITDQLEKIGETYHETRRQIMLTRQEGLTATYNRFHNPDETAADIIKLRQLHVQMDQAVTAAYGWADLSLEYGFHQTAQGLRYTISESARREVLGRLLELNHRRYAEEVALGLHDKKKPGRRGSAAGEEDEGEEIGGQLSLF